jgi:hypothetical protein
LLNFVERLDRYMDWNCRDLVYEKIIRDV